MRALLFVVLANALHFTLAAPSNRWDEFARFTNEVIKCYDIPGLSVSVTSRSETLFAQGFGVLNRETRPPVPVNEHTLFNIASTTKAFTTTLLAMLMEEQEGRRWQTRVRDVLPYFAVNDTVMANLATVADLAAHKIGVPRNDFMWQSGAALQMSRAEQTRRLQYFPAQFGPREGYLYNNWFYMVAGHVAEAWGADSWENLLRRRILAPLGMTRSTTSIDAALASGNYATPYGQPGFGLPLEALPESIHRNMEPVGPMGSFISTAAEMPRWLRMQLREGVNDQGVRIVPAARLRQTRTPEVSTKSNPVHVVNGSNTRYPVDYTAWSYGFGWNIGTYRGYRSDHHGGRAMGHRALVAVYPDAGVGIFIAASGGRWHTHTTVALDLMEMYAFDLAMGFTPWVTAEFACAQVPRSQPAPEQRPQPPLLSGDRWTHWCNTVADYVGVYEHQGYGLVSVTHSGDCSAAAGEASLLLSYAQLRVVLTPVQNAPAGHFDAFFQRPLLLYLGFRGNEIPGRGSVFRAASGGVPASLTLPWLEPVPAAPVFFKK